jgi:F0F1-type ATP synthase assembly protein I
MKTTAAHPSTPPIARKGQSAESSSMLAAATNLSWQLAIVVIVPIFGGAKLDNLFGTKPIITVIGFVIAAVGMGFVVWKQMQLLSPVEDKDAQND